MTISLTGAATDTDFAGTITVHPEGTGVHIVADVSGVDTDGLHGTNEHFRVEMFQRGIETAIVYLDELAQLPR